MSPDYWVHRGPDIVVASDPGGPLALTCAVIGTYGDEFFGPQIDLELRSRAPEVDPNLAVSRTHLSPAETRGLATALVEVADLLGEYDT